MLSDGVKIFTGPAVSADHGEMMCNILSTNVLWPRVQGPVLLSCEGYHPVAKSTHYLYPFSPGKIILLRLSSFSFPKALPREHEKTRVIGPGISSTMTCHVFSPPKLFPISAQFA